MIAVYAGVHLDCVQLQLTLAGEGIDAEVKVGSPSDFGADSHVFVNRLDLERAALLVEDYKKHGSK